VERIYVAEGTDRWLAFAYTVMNFWVPLNVGNFLTTESSIGLSRRTVLCGISSRKIYCNNDCSTFLSAH
jgi:hypothetical protein